MKHGTGHLKIVMRKHYPTSNDPNGQLVTVFCDRCDMKHYHGLPLGEKEPLPVHRTSHCKKDNGYEDYWIN